MKIKSLFLSSAILLSAHLANAASVCRSVFILPDTEQSLSFHTVERFEIIQSKIINLMRSEKIPVIIAGIAKPKWNDYNALVELQEEITKNISPDNSTISYLNANERTQMLASVANDHRVLLDKLSRLLQKNPTPKQRQAYIRFLDDHYAYFKLLENLNRLLKSNIFIVPDLSVLRTNNELTADAVNLVRAIEKTVNRTFSDTGHPSLKDFKTYTEKYSEQAKSLLKITDEHLVVALHRPERARFWVPVAGFQNQRVTGTSNGTMFTDSTPTEPSGRDRIEANLTQTPIDKNIPLSARFKPNYAEARPDNSVTDVKPNSGASQYGSDLWIIKKSVIETRGTWTPADSLAPGWEGQRTGNYDDVFIPWKFRALMTPFALLGENAFTPGLMPPGFKLSGVKRWWMPSDYFEVQIFGPLTIDDVQAFHFQDNPPDKKLYDLLVSKHIEVWDERTWPAKRYNGEESK